MPDERKEASENNANADRQREKVADRPHRYTLWLGLLGPIVTLAAVSIASVSLWTSKSALQISKRSMKVSQRAYLVIQNGWTNQGRPYESGRDKTVTLKYGFDVRNLGRTPATRLYYDFEFGLNKGWEHREYMMTGTFLDFGEPPVQRYDPPS
jgi:hypothetical protein